MRKLLLLTTIAFLSCSSPTKKMDKIEERVRADIESDSLWAEVMLKDYTITLDAPDTMSIEAMKAYQFYHPMTRNDYY